MKSGSTKAALCAGFVLLTGCASGSKDIRSAYVSPMTYESYSCQQLVTENTRLQQRLSAVAGDVDKKAHGDKVKMGVGLVLFWPTLLFLKGDGAEAQEYARLKGEHEAFDEAYLRKNCASQVAVEPSIGPVTQSASVVPVLASSYQGNGLAAAKLALEKKECSDKFSIVSEVNGRGVYEATCKSGKRQLMECWAGTCRALN